MKRGKDEEKIVGPMFPRLHVNDKEKGGPRAPPRNKMALYEQLSIPSQRFNPGVLPLNHNNTTNLVHPQSSSQENSHERVADFPRYIPPTLQVEKQHGRYSNLGSPRVQIEHKRIEEDDFTVPIFVHTGTDQTSRQANNHPMEFQNSSDREPVKSVSNLSAGEKMLGSPKKTNLSPNQQYEDHCASNFSRLQNHDSYLQQKYGDGSRSNNFARGHGFSDEPRRVLERESSLIARREFHQEEPMSPGNAVNHNENLEDETHGSLQNGHLDEGDDVSDASMVDSLSGLDISPDDVVGIIGQKHFWKARKAIVNQQRVFAVQVFELHRLIKVQRLIAESPNILVEENAFLGKTIKGSPPKKLPLEYIVKPPPQILKHKDGSEKLNQKIEISAENAMGKTSQSPSSVQNLCHPLHYGPFSGNPPPTSITTDPRMAPWCFPQSPGHQWLLPVMSPSEGLVYKPYPGPRFMGPGSGGYGSPGSTQMGGNFMNPAYTVLPTQQYHGMGIPSLGQGYFRPFMSPSMSGSAEMNSFTGPSPYGHPSQQFDMQNQTSCNVPRPQGHPSQHFNTQNEISCTVPIPRNRAVPNVTKLVSIDSEVQGSTASSPSERAQVGNNHTNKGTNALPLFPTSPAVVRAPEVQSRTLEIDQPTRVIKVVPHNARSATESAARRIFQSIQKERKQNDSV